MPERKLKVFLSSTAKDLTAFRKAVHARLAASPLFECIRQEEFFAQPHPPVTVCREQVFKADLFVGLIGMRRGWEPPDDNSDHRSITEMEYDWATDVAPRFMHVTDTEFPVPGSLRESDEVHQRQLGFRQRVMNELVVSQDGFVSPDGLSSPDVLARLVVDQLTKHVLDSDLIERIRPRLAPVDDPALKGLPDAIAERILQLLDERGDLKKAERGGLEPDIVFKLAKRIKPDDTLDFDRAVAELENAITIALDAIARGRRGSNEDEFVNHALRNVATHTQAGETERAVKTLDDALNELDSREAEQRETLKRSRLTLLEAGLAQDLLRRDPGAAAQRVARLVEVEHFEDPAGRFDALHRRWKTFREEGRNKGLSLSLGVAIEIARVAVDVADTADRRGIALNALGIALDELGEHESGTTRLYEAAVAYREALKEWTRERVPFDWAKVQNNLGNALLTIGDRESSTARLDEAVSAYREALTEYTRERMPLDWAWTQNNLGNALRIIGERENGTVRLNEAVGAFCEALKERTRDREPIRWAITQNNLGTALMSLGEREHGTTQLDEAVAAFREALKERTRERLPLDWAVSTGNQGVALMRLAERRADTAMAAAAVNQIEQALGVMRDIGHGPYAQYYERQLPKARAIRDRLTKA